MTQEEWIRRVEEASGMSRQQFESLGLRIVQLTCRRLECLGWHFEVAHRPEERGIESPAVKG